MIEYRGFINNICKPYKMIDVTLRNHFKYFRQDMNFAFDVNFTLPFLDKLI